MEDNILDFLEEIEPHYKGLGMPILYGVLSIMANKSVFFIAIRGQGKTTAITLIPELPDTLVSNWDSFTLQGLDEDVGQVHDAHLVWKVLDFNTLSKYHRRIFLDVVPKIITDGSYHHHTKSLNIDIANCQLNLLVAIQPMLYSELCRTESRWESMAVDRFSKFLLLNPLRTSTYDAPLTVKIPETYIKPIMSLKACEIEKVENLYAGQEISKGRRFLYMRDYLSAFASFCGDAEVTEKHAGLFYDLFNVYLEAFNRLQYAKDLESSVEIQAGQMKLLNEVSSYEHGVTKKELAKTFRVGERNVEKYAVGLLESKLIEKDIRTGRGNCTTYRLAPPFTAFFDSYQERFTR